MSRKDLPHWQRERQIITRPPSWVRFLVEEYARREARQLETKPRSIDDIAANAIINFLAEAFTEQQQEQLLEIEDSKGDVA